MEIGRFYYDYYEAFLICMLLEWKCGAQRTENEEKKKINFQWQQKTMQKI